MRRPARVLRVRRSIACRFSVARLTISARTVESHLRRLFERHNVASRTELASRAIREGWLEGLS